MATRTFLFVDQVASTEQLTRLGDRSAQVVRRALFDLLREATAVAGGQEVDATGDGLFCSSPPPAWPRSPCSSSGWSARP